MDKVAFLQLFILVFITCVKLNQCFITRTIYVRKDHEQTRLRSCAADFLFKNDYVGVRMKNETGACEGLSSDFATHEEIIDKSYAYAYRLQYDELYRPPLESDSYNWTLPGIFESGAQLEVTAILSLHSIIDIMYMRLLDEQSRILMQFGMQDASMTLREHNGTAEWQDTQYLGDFEDDADGKLTLTVKMLFVTEAHFIKAYLNGKEIVQEHDPILPINTIRTFSMSSPFQTHSIVSLKFKHKYSKESFDTSF